MDDKDLASSGEQNAAVGNESAGKRKQSKKKKKSSASAAAAERSSEEQVETPAAVEDGSTKKKKQKKKKKQSGAEKKKFDPLAELNDDQKEALRLFKIRLSLEKGDDGEIGEDKWSKRQLAWLDDMCLLRYLRARDYDLDLSEGMIRATLKWRKEYKPHKITAQEVEPEARQAKLYLHVSYDKADRPIVYMKPGLDTGTDRNLKVKYMVYTLEKAIEAMDTESGVEKMSWLADFTGSGMRQSSLGNIQLSKECLHIVCDHYPERLGKAFLINTPWVFGAFWKCISPLIPPITAEKIRVFGDDYHTEVHDCIAAHALEKAYGGESDFDYDHEKWCHEHGVTPGEASKKKSKA